MLVVILMPKMEADVYSGRAVGVGC